MNTASRRVLTAAVLAALVVLAAGCGGSGRSGIISPVLTVRVRTLPAALAKRIAASVPGLRLAVTVPRRLGRYEIRGGGHEAFHRPSVIGIIATDDPGAYQSWEGLAKWWHHSSNGPPANKVAFQISQWLPGRTALLPASALRLHLPLSLHQPWFREHPRNGYNGYRWGYLRVHGQIYEAAFWNGRAAPARDRAAVLSVLASVHARH